MKALDALNTEIKLHNFFDIIAKDVESGEEIKAHAENVVLNKFYTAVAAGSTNAGGVNTIYVGSGTNTPLATDTALQTQLLARNTSGSWNITQLKEGGTGVLAFTGSMQIETTELVGSTITEIGLGYTSQGLVTRALLQDANGNTISIPKTNTMVVVVYATAFLTIPTTISGYKIIARGGTVFEIEPYQIQLFVNMDRILFRMKRCNKSWYEAKQPDPLVALPSANVTATAVIDSPNLKRSYSYASVPVGTANIGGIRSICLGYNSSFGGWIEVPVPNDTIQQPVLTKEVVGTGDGTNTLFNTEFGWIRDNETLKVYVNDVEQTSGFTVKYNLPPATQGSYYMEATGKTNSLGSPTFENVSGKKVVKTKSSNRTGHYITASDSPDGVFTNVVLISAANTDYAIPAAYQNKRYWGANDSYSINNSNATTFTLEADIAFDTAPATGSTVAVSYQPDCIAKNNTRILNNIAYALSIAP